MSIQAYALTLGDEDEGVALVCTTTGAPIPISRHSFVDVDEAEAFIAWCAYVHGDARHLSVTGLERARKEWMTRQ